MWINTPANLPGHYSNLTYNHTVDVLCPSMFSGPINKTLSRMNLSSSSVVVAPPSLNGCSKVVALPLKGPVYRFVYKFLFALTDKQWGVFYKAMVNATTVKSGHVMCGSTLFFQALNGTNAPNGTLPLSIANHRQWLSPTASPLVCHNDVGVVNKTLFIF